jgi:hypothetical protein
MPTDNVTDAPSYIGLSDIGAKEAVAKKRAIVTFGDFPIRPALRNPRY